ncbi:MAG: sugar-binding protein [Phycisphaerae bacterium]
MHKFAAVAMSVFAVTIAALVAVTLAQPSASAPANEVVVKGISGLAVTFDGHVSKLEYADATHSTFPNGHGTVDVFTKCQDGFLYFAFQIPDLSPFEGDDIVIMLDTANARKAAPDEADIRAYVRRKMENSRAQQGDGKKWADTYGDWEYRSALYPNGWEVEARIPLKSLKIATAAAKPAVMGLAFRIWDNKPQGNSNWPVGSNENKPDTWGTLQLQLGPS